MADTPEAPVVHIGENSPEQVAYKLLQCLSEIENKPINDRSRTTADRKWLLDTYAECLLTVLRPQRRENV